MKPYLIDSDILIDYLRLYAPAITFLEALPKESLNIAVLSHFELLKGCTTKLQAQRVQRFLKHFKILHMDEALDKKALALFFENRWRCNMDIPDSFIAATALKRNMVLVTKNLKHYRSIEGLMVERPY